ncbi:MAG: ATP-binding protein, partial [Sneathiella sp.]
VFELYSDVTPLVAEINSMTLKVVMALFASFGLLYAVLFWIVRHANLVMNKQHVDLVIAQKEALSSNTAKSSFLATMSHEIRTPLNGVLGLAQLLLNDDLTKDQQRHVKTIVSSGETLLAIISDVLDMSKIEASGIQLEEKPFNLKNLISVIATPFQSLIDDKGLTLSVKFDFDSALTVKGDPVRLRQILWNLISNAIKFTEAGSIAVRIRKVNAQTVGISDAKDMVLNFAVIDTGSGIAPERLDKIFDPFTQENSSITRKHGGTGLGLAIVKQLTEIMGGIIKVESELNQGTRFDVFIPLIKESNFLVEEKSQTFIDRKISLNVIVAEDNDVNATIATAFLKKAGCQVRLAENGLQAVEAAQDNWADLILMDIHMPEMNGIDATIQIRTKYNNKELPIVGLTADAFLERHEQFVESGMNSVLTKPFTQQQLDDVLDLYRNRLSEEKAAS